MMTRVKYDPKELEVIGTQPCGMAGMLRDMGMGEMPPEPLYNRPITEKENWKLMFSGKKPYWIPNAGAAYGDIHPFRPRIHPDNVATHSICDGEPPIQYESNVTRSSWFDLDWVYVPVAGGATVMPGSPKVPDINRWEQYVSLPDLDAMDWEGCAKNNVEYLNTPKMVELCILTGFWERLISLMDVENAAVALIDEDQQEGVHRLFDKLVDVYCGFIDGIHKRCPIDAVYMHDDWGHQNGSFFSLETAREMLVPYLRRVTDFVHSKGMHFEIHSCGKNERLVPAYIEAGADMWCGQPLNDFCKMAHDYKEYNFVFGVYMSDIPADTSTEECYRLAQEWFDKYEGCHVATAFFGNPPETFKQALYEISRRAWENEPEA